MNRFACLRGGAAALTMVFVLAFAPLTQAAVTTIAVGAVGTTADAGGDGTGDAGAETGSFYLSAGVHGSGPPEVTGTSRMQFEFDISGLGAGPVTSAEVQLNTETDAFSPIDTTFFATTVDGNGTIEATDFQAPAAAISGAVMPPSGTSTFVFDVTSEVNTALAAGHHWFVVQGRVDETLGPSYERGRQVESRSGSVPADERPRLVVASDALPPPPVTPSAIAVPGLGGVALAMLALALGLSGFAASRRRR